MLPTLLYLLKANAALLLFAAAYFGLLRRLTFFSLNRVYLAFVFLFSALYPVLPVPALLPAVAAEPVAYVVTYSEGPGLAARASVAAPAIRWETVALAVYAAGAAVLLARLLVQLLSLWRLRRTARPALLHGQEVRTLAGAVRPFSFWQTIYLNPAQHPAPELAAVLRHEQVHVRQWHTLDVLLAHVALAAAWCNPAAWLLRRALLDNLEYLADHAALQTGLDRQAYQYSLVRLSRGAAGPSLVSHFTFPTLKNRVAMMNTPFSSTGQLARYLVAGPLVLAVALGFSAARAQGAGPAVPAQATAVQPAAKAAPQPGVAVKAATATPAARATRAAKVAKVRAAQPGATPAVSPAAATPSVRIRLDGPKDRVPRPVYYVDGKVFSDDLNVMNPNDIASISVLKDEQARQLAGETGTAGVVVITTRQNQNSPDVRAFNGKLGVAAPAAAPTGGVPYLAAPALAYITKTYPDARLLAVLEVPTTDGGAPRYKAELAIGRRPLALLFDGQGQFISEVPYTR
ncbi:MAG: hypothetical protein JWR44_1164 [Hymenobacter sp.]|jgi:hypothetical protein|nr:hypothetical protein [Hymenobacter sp.]